MSISTVKRGCNTVTEELDGPVAGRRDKPLDFRSL
jgi:hypothetical protein